MNTIELDGEGRRRFLDSLSLDPGVAHWVVGADNMLSAQLMQDLAAKGPPDSARRTRRLGLPWRVGADAAVNAVFGLETLFPELTVLDNLYIGRPASWRRPAELAQRARAAFEVLGSDLQPAMPAHKLTDLQRHTLALARAMLTPAPLTLIHCNPDEPLAAARLNRAVRYLLRQRDPQPAVVVLAPCFIDLHWVTHLHCVRSGHWVYGGPAEPDWRLHWAVATAESVPESEAAIRRSLKHMQDTGNGGALAFAQAAMSLGRVCLRSPTLDCVFLDRMGQLSATEGARTVPWFEPARQRLIELRRPGAVRRSHTLHTPAGPLLALPLIGKGGAFGLLVAGTSDNQPSRDQTAFVQVFGRMLGEVIGEEMLDVQLAHARRLDTLGTMAGGLVHDFNNTLFVIDSAARLAGGQTLDDDARRQIEVIRKAVQQAGALTSKLRSFGQRHDPQSAPLNLHDVVLDALTLLRVAAGSTVQIDCALDAQCARMVGDPAALINMVVNLGMNAVNALGEHQRHILIRTTSHPGPSSWISFQGVRQRGAYLELDMTDTGCGMDAATMSRLFEPFFTTRAEAGGTGLGLATVIQTVRQHGGAIDITSTPGEGTTVRLRFPVAETLSAEIAAAAPAVQVSRSAAGLHALVCDDDELTREVLTDMLQTRGVRVTTAPDGRTCLDLYAHATPPYDFVLLDYRMPGMDGETCFRALKTLDPEVRAIILSGHPGDVNTADLLALGLLGVFHKPVEAQTLLDVIGAAASIELAGAASTARNTSGLTQTT